MSLFKTTLVGGTIIALYLAREPALCQAPGDHSSAAEKASSVPAQSITVQSEANESGWLIQHERVRRIIGLRVENPDGQGLGRVRDFVLDMQTGQIKYALLSWGGVLGLGAKVRAVPVRVLSMATAKRGTLALDISKASWDGAPHFKGRLAGLTDPNQAQQIDQYYGIPLPETSAAPVASPTRTPAATSTGRGRSLRLASAAIGLQVVDRERQTIGKVSDLEVDLGGKWPALAIISGDRSSGRGESFAVLLPMLTLTNQNELVADASRSAFAEAPAFSVGLWQTAGASNRPGIYRYVER